MKTSVSPAAPADRLPRMSLFNTDSGFTLIELMVVIALLSLVLYAVVPNFSASPITDQPDKAARLIIMKIRSLKSLAVQERKIYILNIDMDQKRIWATNAGMEEAAMEKEAERAITLTEDLFIREVAMPAKGRASSGTVEILFYPGGYSEQALIFLETSEGKQLTLEVQPFLPDVKIHEMVR